MQFNRQELMDHVRRWQESGLTKAAYCRREKIPYGPFVARAQGVTQHATADGSHSDPQFVQVASILGTEGGMASLSDLSVRVRGFDLGFSCSCPAVWVGQVVAEVAKC